MNIPDGRNRQQYSNSRGLHYRTFNDVQEIKTKQLSKWHGISIKRHVNQWNTIKPRNIHINGQLIQDKGAKIHNEKRTVSSMNGAVKNSQPYAK